MSETVGLHDDGEHVVLEGPDGSASACASTRRCVPPSAATGPQLEQVRARAPARCRRARSRRGSGPARRPRRSPTSRHAGRDRPPLRGPGARRARVRRRRRPAATRIGHDPGRPCSATWSPTGSPPGASTPRAIAWDAYRSAAPARGPSRSRFEVGGARALGPLDLRHREPPRARRRRRGPLAVRDRARRRADPPSAPRRRARTTCSTSRWTTRLRPARSTLRIDPTGRAAPEPDPRAATHALLDDLAGRRGVRQQVDGRRRRRARSSRASARSTPSTSSDPRGRRRVPARHPPALAARPGGGRPGAPADARRSPRHGRRPTVTAARAGRRGDRGDAASTRHPTADPRRAAAQGPRRACRAGTRSSSAPSTRVAARADRCEGARAVTRRAWRPRQPPRVCGRRRGRPGDRRGHPAHVVTPAQHLVRRRRPRRRRCPRRRPARPRRPSTPSTVRALCVARAPHQHSVCTWSTSTRSASSMSRAEPGNSRVRKSVGDPERVRRRRRARRPAAASCSTCVGRVELGLVADQVVDRLARACAAATTSSQKSVRVGHLDAPTPQAEARGQHARRPARSLRVKSTPSRPRAAWLWSICSARVDLPESIVPEKNASSAIGAPSSARAYRPRSRAPSRSGTSISPGVERAVHPDAASSECGVCVRESRRRRGRSRATTSRRSTGARARATGPNQPAATASAPVATTAAPERRPPAPRPRAPAPRRSGSSPVRRRAGAAHAAPPPTSSTPVGERAGCCATSQRWARVDVDHAVVGRDHAAACRAGSERASRPSSRSSARERVAPLPRPPAVVVPDLVDVAPVQVDERRARRARHSAASTRSASDSAADVRARRAARPRVRPEPANRAGPTRGHRDARRRRALEQRAARAATRAASARPSQETRFASRPGRRVRARCSRRSPVRPAAAPVPNDAHRGRRRRRVADGAAPALARAAAAGTARGRRARASIVQPEAVDEHDAHPARAAAAPQRARRAAAPRPGHVGDAERPPATRGQHRRRGSARRTSGRRRSPRGRVGGRASRATPSERPSSRSCASRRTAPGRRRPRRGRRPCPRPAALTRTTTSSGVRVPVRPWSASHCGSPHVAGSRSIARHGAPADRERELGRRVARRGAARARRRRASARPCAARAAAPTRSSPRRSPTGCSLSAGWSSTCATTSRVGVSTRTVTCRRTSAASNVVSGWTRWATTCSSAERDVEDVTDELGVVARRGAGSWRRSVDAAGTASILPPRAGRQPGRSPVGTRRAPSGRAARGASPSRAAGRRASSTRARQHRRAALGDDHGVQLEAAQLGEVVGEHRRPARARPRAPRRRAAGRPAVAEQPRCGARRRGPSRRRRRRSAAATP